MATHSFDNWKQYLSDDDYLFLMSYLENIKNNLPNNKMVILCGPGRNGKSTLIKEIIEYLGDERCGMQPASDDIIHNESIKQIMVLSELCKIRRSKKKNNAIINLIKYQQSFMSEAVSLKEVNDKLLDFSKVIKMEHVF
tara:strand:+ start:797 stop:1213 length:417 start_codon:yes stop_codon:yes gene_type:complete